MQAAQSQDDQAYLDGKAVTNVSSPDWAGAPCQQQRPPQILTCSQKQPCLAWGAQITIVGKIVHVEEQQLMSLYTIDDGSGRVLAKYWTPDNDDDFVSLLMDVCIFITALSLSSAPASSLRTLPGWDKMWGGAWARAWANYM